METERKRVLLIDPPMYKHPLWDPIRTSQPLGIWSIGSYLQAKGHDVRLVCAPLQGLQHIEKVGDPTKHTTLDRVLQSRLNRLESTTNGSIVDRWFSDPSLLRVGLSDKQILAEVSAFNPDIVGISALASCMHQSFVSVARAIRRRYPELPIVVGGQHATAMPYELLRDGAGAIDLLIRGEAEFVFEQVVNQLPDIEAAKELPGVAHLDQSGQLVEHKRPEWTDIEKLALLDPKLMYHVPLPPLPVHMYGNTPKQYTDMMFSVGCHRSCPFCFSPVMRGKLRQLSGDGISKQLKLLRDAGYDEIILQDDDLLQDKQFFLGLLNTIADVGMTWQDCGGMNLEMFDDELADAVISSGCTAIYVPVNPRQLSDRLPTEKAVENVHYLRRLKDGGVYTFTSGIYGVPNLRQPSKTYDDLLQLRDFHQKLVTKGLVDASLVFPLSALPGTPWFRQVENNPAFEFDRERWIGYSVFVPQVYPKELGAQRLWREILETHRALNEVQSSFPWFSPFPNRL